MNFQLCPTCNRPLVCERNLRILRKIILASGVIGGLLTGICVLPLIGFGAGGIIAGSLAATWQGTIGNVAAGSLFAILQSMGATTMGTFLFGTIGTIGGATGALGILRRFANRLNFCTCGTFEPESDQPETE